MQQYSLFQSAFCQFCITIISEKGADAQLHIDNAVILINLCKTDCVSTSTKLWNMLFVSSLAHVLLMHFLNSKYHENIELCVHATLGQARIYAFWFPACAS